MPLDACVLPGRSLPLGSTADPALPSRRSGCRWSLTGSGWPRRRQHHQVSCPGGPETDNANGLWRWEFLRSIARAGASSASSGVRAGGASPGGVGVANAEAGRREPERRERRLTLREPTHTRLRRRLFRSTGFRGRAAGLSPLSRRPSPTMLEALQQTGPSGGRRTVPSGVLRARGNFFFSGSAF